MSVSQPKLSQTLMHLQAHPETQILQFARKLDDFFDNNTQETPISRGFAEWISHNNNSNSLLIDHDHSNYIKALQAIKATVNQDPDAALGSKLLGQRSSDEIITAIMKLYKLIDQSVDDGYRKEPTTIVNPDFTLPFTSSKEDRASLFRTHWDQYFQKTPPDDYATYKRLRKKVWDYYFNAKYTGQRIFTDQESQFLVKHNRLTDPFVRPSDLEKETKAFAEKFAEEYKSIKDVQTALKVMAFAHYHLIKLHIKKDGNGRVARLFMSWIALESQTGKIEVNPVLLEDSKEYDKAALNLEQFTNLITTWHTEQSKMTLNQKAYFVIAGNIQLNFNVCLKFGPKF